MMRERLAASPLVSLPELHPDMLRQTAGPPIMPPSFLQPDIVFELSWSIAKNKPVAFAGLA